MRFISVFISSIIFVSIVFGGDMLSVGQKAPGFELKDAHGTTHKLSQYSGKIVVLYFYPKDDTPGCTAEACNIRDNFDVLTDKGIIVLGVSFDDQDSHKEFTDKYDLPFPILSDTSKAVTKMYGAERNALLGFVGPKRITYLIDGKQNIIHLFDSVDTKNHSAQILEVLESKGIIK